MLPRLQLSPMHRRLTRNNTRLRHIPTQRLPHIKRILIRFRVILLYPPVHRIPHPLVHLDGFLVADPDVQVDKVHGTLFGDGFEAFHELGGDAEFAVEGGDGDG